MSVQSIVWREDKWQVFPSKKSMSMGSIPRNRLLRIYKAKKENKEKKVYVCLY